MSQNTYKNVCTKLIRKEPDGTEVREPKVAFDNLDKAIEAAKNLNARGNADHKVVAYKCNTCHKYHVGRNKSPLVRNRKYTTIDDINRINKFKSKEPESRGLRKWS